MRQLHRLTDYQEKSKENLGIFEFGFDATEYVKHIDKSLETKNIFELITRGLFYGKLPDEQVIIERVKDLIDKYPIQYMVSKHISECIYHTDLQLYKIKFSPLIVKF